MIWASPTPPLPGFNIPLNCEPKRRVGHGFEVHGQIGFPNGLDISNGYASHLDVKREIVMMQLMNTITDKPDWDRKVFDQFIIEKWREEIAQSGEDVSPKMMDWIIKELQWKFEKFRATGRITVFDVGVVKTDNAISPELQQALRKAVAPFEDVPEDQKDYHPGSNQQVVDLVHPSLFPVIFGRTRVLKDQLIDLDTCLGSVGQGVALPVPSKEEAAVRQQDDYYRAVPCEYSRKFQWLPCEVKFTSDGECRIDSYINNVHPTKHRDLYEVLEEILTKVVPQWNQTLAYRPEDQRRIPYGGVDYEQDLDHLRPNYDKFENDEEYEAAYDAWIDSHVIVQPEPEEFTAPDLDQWALVDLQRDFEMEGLQVIVKLANIELSPEKPEYAGGSWHIEGQLNERICATAIYYYDSHNITESRLAFRQRGDQNYFQDFGYEQNRHEFLQAVYGYSADVSGYGDANITQYLGSVVCREGRLLTFPNVVQHCVSPFSLEDRSKPGHRKILALFLIDPHRRIISSANVPPQQEEWGTERRKAVDNVLSQKLPPELQDMVEKEISDAFITMEEAKSYRLELMEERSVKAEASNAAFETGDFSLCEH